MIEVLTRSRQNQDGSTASYTVREIYTFDTSLVTHRYIITGTCTQLLVSTAIV